MREIQCDLSTSAGNAAPSFLVGGGETGRLIASHDWAATPLGPVEGWPQSLRTATSILLRSPVPIVMLWGDDGIMLYNDAYSMFAGGRHPALLGSKVREGWPEVADFNDKVMKVGLAGGTLAYEDQELTLYRHGRPEQVWMNLDYSPVLDESGKPAGVICILNETTERIAVERRAKESAERFRAFVTASSSSMYRMSPDWTEMRQLDGQGFLSDTETPSTDWLEAYIHPDDQPHVKAAIQRAIANETTFELEHRVRLADGSLGWTQSRAVPIRDDEGRIIKWFGAAADVTERKRGEALRAAQSRVLQLAVQDTPLADALDAIVTTVEDLSPAGMIGSILLMDEDGLHLRHGAAPSLPAAYNAAIDGLVIGPAVGSCGTAAYRKAPVYVRDIAVDPLWADFRDLALAHRLRACWSTPILSGQGNVLGTFAMYYRTPRAPNPADEELVDFVVHTAALVIECKRADAALRSSEEQFRTFAESMANPAWAALPDGRLDWFNGRVYEYTGTVQDDLDSDAWVRIVHPDDVDRVVGSWTASLRTGANFQEEFRLRRADGTYRWHIARALPVRDGAGRITRWIGTSTDIQDVMEAREVLARSREELEVRVEEALAGRKLWADIFETSDALIGVLDPDYRFLAMNRSYADEFQRIYGIRPQVGDRLPALLASMPEHQEAALAVWRRALQGEKFTITEEFGDPARERPCYELSYDTLHDRDGNLIGAFQYAVDVTERLRSQTRLADAEAALRQSQKMEAVGQLTGGVAHDFNNLLQIVTGNLDMLLRRLPENEARLRRAASNAMTGAKRAAALTQRLLAFSRRQPLQPKVISVNRLVTGMSDLLRRTLGETIDVEIPLGDGLWPVEADPNQLEAAILNLAVNARDAMPEGGRLTIATANARLDGHGAEAASVPPGEYVMISISDTGTGMDKGTMTKVFEPFFTTKEVGKGTGLGLSQVYGFVKQSGGDVKISSEVGAGTAVRIYLPRLFDDAAEEEAAADRPAPEGTRLETILVVEDDDDVRAYAVEVLRELGYRVLEAHDGPSALRLLDRQDGRVDLLLSDMVLPGGMSGADIAGKACDLLPDLKVLFTTGYARDTIFHHGRIDAGVHLLTKPFAFTELAAKVRDVLDGRA
ncbi:MAG: PAS domain-containing protein [Pararhizobium sp.]